MADGYEADALMFDWNEIGSAPLSRPIELNDETLRDGMQSPSITDPPIEVKIEALHYMAQLGIHNANIGMPCTSPKIKEATLQLAKVIADEKLSIRPNCAARTVVSDVQAIVDVAQAAGIPVMAATFIGSSPIRSLAEGWDLDRMRHSTEEAITFAVKQQLPVMYVTEDTTRARPKVLKLLYRTAIDSGASRLCIADTVGHSTPRGTRRIVQFFKEEIVGGRTDLVIDWHGHNDRGLAVANALAAFEAGADCVHGTILGIGERVGNTSLDQLLVNLVLLGWLESDLSALNSYCRLIHERCDAPLPYNYPVLGRDAFRTSTGVHASAILKAQQKGEEFLANRVYSSVPADLVGRRQEIEVGPMSGQSNVIFWLQAHGVEPQPDLIDEILTQAKSADRVLSDREIEGILKRRNERERGG
jgi:2-isopropylmalate synthase